MPINNVKAPRAFIAFLMAATFVISVHATVVHAIDVRALVESSDVIVVGRVLSINRQGTANIVMPGASIPAEKFLAVIAVDETLKGRLEKANVSLEFTVPDRPAGIHGIPANQYGMFFLQRGTSDFKISDLVYPFLPAVRGAPPAAGLPLDRVTAELAGVLTSKDSTGAETSTALDALVTIPGTAATESLRRALESSSGELQLRIASKLVARNDISGLSVVKVGLMQPAKSVGYLLPELAGSLAGLKDPRSIPTLKRLLELDNPLVTKGVAIALRQSGSADALQPLSYLLDKNDEQVRYYAVVGMGEITRQDEWTPTFSEFHEHEAKYLSYWREWALSNISSSPD